MTDRRREQLVCGAALALLGGLFAVLAAWSVPSHDDWYQRFWLRDGLGLDVLWRALRYNYLHANPRIGDVFLIAVNGPRWVHVIVTPLAQLGLLWAAFVVAFGRRPAARYGDLRLALVLQVLIWVISPIPGVVYFYRPFATNYLFAFATTLALFAAYRLALASRHPGQRWWRAPGMLALGWLAGMSNEHTGPTAIACVLAAIAWAWRQPRLRGARGWMIAGAIGLILGYAMLVMAPGQAERYAGRAARYSALGLIASRGVTGTYEVLANFVGEAQWGIDLVLLAALWFVCEQRRRGEPVALPLATARAIAGLVAAAGAIVVTLFASPVTVERLLFAPAVLLSGALAVIAEHAMQARRIRIAITWACAAIFAYHAFRFVEVYAAARREGEARATLLAAARPGTIAMVPPYRTPRSRWFRGDDFRPADVREYVAHEVYELAGIELSPRPTSAEPTPSGAYTETPAVGAHRASAFVSTALLVLRQRLALGDAPTSYRIDATQTGFDDAKHRPLHLLEWTSSALRYVDGAPSDGPDREQALRLWPPSLPSGWTEAYTVGCGRTVPVEPRRDGDDLLLPLAFDCRGPYTGVICDAAACWIAGRYGR